LLQRGNRLFAALQEHGSLDRVVVVHAHLLKPRIDSSRTSAKFCK
jgi:hypothetical protein